MGNNCCNNKIATDSAEKHIMIRLTTFVFFSLIICFPFSYSWKYKPEIAIKVYHDLISYGYNVWMDRFNEVGSNLNKEIASAVENSYLINNGV